MENNNDLIIIQDTTNEITSDIENLQINNQTDYEVATSILKQVKQVSKQVTEYWKEPKEQASKTHKNIVAKEKQMLEPLKNAETIIKNKMSDYMMILEKQRLEEEKRLKEEQERLALEELKRAEELKAEGNNIEAEIVEQNAIAIGGMETKVESKATKVEGVSYKKDYEIIITEPIKVPSYINGVEIRKIDTSMIKQLVKMSNNQIKIDGIEVKEKKIVAVRS